MKDSDSVEAANQEDTSPQEAFRYDEMPACHNRNSHYKDKSVSQPTYLLGRKDRNPQVK